MIPAIIVDVDWTIAEKWNRNPYDFTKVIEDTPILPIIELVHILSSTHDIIFASWRSDECRKDTEEWLNRYFDYWYELYMRKEGDKRKDDIVKYEILQELQKKYEIKYVVDDRDQVVKMWRDNWLTCLQVAYWNF